MKVESLAQGKFKQVAEGARPCDFKTDFEFKGFRRVDGVFDADVTLAGPDPPEGVRLVAVRVPGKATCVFLTNLSRESHPAELVGDLYRLRWEIENDNKLDKSDWRLDKIDARKPHSVHALIMASLLGSVLVNRLVHRDHLELADELSAGSRMRKGPLHARLVALCHAACHSSLPRALADPTFDPDAVRRASIVVDVDGRDPNWRNSPSVFDRLHGFVGRRVRPRNKRRGRQKTIGQRTGPPVDDRQDASN